MARKVIKKDRARHYMVEQIGGQKFVLVIPMSFDTGQQGAVKVPFSDEVKIQSIFSIVTKALAGTDAGTIQGASDVGNFTAGLITHALSAAIGVNQTVSPTGTNTTILRGGHLLLTPAKTTAGGKAMVTITGQWN